MKRTCKPSTNRHHGRFAHLTAPISITRAMTRWTIALAVIAAAPLARAVSQDEYWRTDGKTGDTWTSTDWNIGSANTTGGTGWTSGNNAVFTAPSTLTFATSTVGNVSVTNAAAVTVAAGGTLTLGGVRTFDIGIGSTLTWTSQTQSTAAGNEGAGLIKNGGGTLNWGAGPGTNVRYDGGFTLNAGTMIVSGANALSSGPLTFNGGTLQSSGTQAFTSSSITIGGDFAVAGTGNANFDLATTIALGSATRTITNNTTSGSRQFRGLISGATNVGLTFAGTGAAQIYVGNTGNTFSGPIAITGGEVVFNDNGSFGATTSITLDGGRLTMASMATNGNTSALTAATIATSRNLFVGATAGTSISIASSGVTTYDGVIADKSGSAGIVVKQGSGTFVLGGVSTYTGDTSINNGTIQLHSGNDRLPTGTTVNLGQAGSPNLGELDLNGQNQQVAGLTSTTGTNASTTLKNTVTSSTAATLTLGGSGTYAYGDGSLTNSGVLTGALAVSKTGSGTQTLGDANSYTGNTAVNGGTLLVTNASGSGTGAGNVTVSNAGSTLGGGTAAGTGGISGSVTVGASAKMAPGTTAGTTAVLSTGALTLQSGSMHAVDITGAAAAGVTAAAGTTYDQINVAGTVTVGGTLVLTVTAYTPTSATNDEYFIVNNDGADAVVGTYSSITGLPSGYGIDYSADFATGALTGGNDIAIVGAPEPATVVGGLLMIGALGWSQRRRFGSLRIIS